jgi:hypothetical protein
MPQQYIRIPFPILRILLPADEEILGFVIGQENKWPENQGKGKFETDEYAEVAFGYKLRAQDKDKNAEGPWGPGIKDEGSYVHLQGGWRVHTHVPGHNDYFDGTFTAKLTASMVGANLIPEISEFKLSWNKDLWGKIITGVAKEKFQLLQNKIERQTQDQINRYLEGEVRQKFNEMVNSDPYLRKLRDRTLMGIEGTTLVLTVRTDQ